jgi:hypothetical protein
MLGLNDMEYASIMRGLVGASSYIKRDTPVGKQLAEAIQILKQTAKGKAVPSGGSATEKLIIDSIDMTMSKDEKLKNLMQMFGIQR